MNNKKFKNDKKYEVHFQDSVAAHCPQKVGERTMETSLPLCREEEEPPCHPVTHDVNNSLPPVVERGMDHEGMSHAGRGGGGGEG